MTDSSEEHVIVPPVPRPLSEQARRTYLRLELAEQLYLFYALIPLLVSGLVMLPSTFLLRNALVQVLVQSRWGYQQVSGSIMSKQKQQTNAAQGRSYTLYAVRFQYVYQQISYRGVQFVWEADLKPTLRLGQTVPVEFSRHLPKFSRLAGFQRLQDNSQVALYILLFVLLSLWGLSLYWVYRGLSPRWRRKYIYRYGTPIQATILEVGPHPEQLLVGQRPWQIRWTFTPEEQEMIGSYTTMHARHLLAMGQPGDTIVVLYHPQDPQQSLPFLQDVSST